LQAEIPQKAKVGIFSSLVVRAKREREGLYSFRVEQVQKQPAEI
jgi:hypothetical protein